MITYPSALYGGGVFASKPVVSARHLHGASSLPLLGHQFLLVSIRAMRSAAGRQPQKHKTDAASGTKTLANVQRLTLLQAAA